MFSLFSIKKFRYVCVLAPLKSIPNTFSVLLTNTMTILEILNERFIAALKLNESQDQPLYLFSIIYILNASVARVTVVYQFYRKIPPACSMR